MAEPNHVYNISRGRNQLKTSYFSIHGHINPSFLVDMSSDVARIDGGVVMWILHGYTANAVSEVLCTSTEDVKELRKRRKADSQVILIAYSKGNIQELKFLYMYICLIYFLDYNQLLLFCLLSL